MLNKTAELGIQVLLYLALRGADTPAPPRAIADALDSSPTYTAKVAGLLVKAGLLTAVRGAHGGVTLSRAPKELALIEIVEACQGKILADYCAPFDDLSLVCAYHEAMHKLHSAITGVLSRYTLADLAARPCPHQSIRRKVSCKLKWCERL